MPGAIDWGGGASKNWMLRSLTAKSIEQQPLLIFITDSASIF
jgi:hypothetical protein